MRSQLITDVRLTPDEVDIAENNERYWKGEATELEKEYEFSKLSKAEFEKQMEGAIVPSELGEGI